MKFQKKIVPVIVLLISVFSFSKMENTTTKSSLNLEQINIIEVLSHQESECRPSSKIMFYVKTSFVKKYRGFNTINASVYILDRVSGQSNLLANENIVIPSYKDAVLQYDAVTSDYEKTVLRNGDIIVGGGTHTSYRFKELIKHEVIYASYRRATNTSISSSLLFKQHLL